MVKQLSVCRECNAHKAAAFLCLFIFTGFFLQMLSGNLPVQGPENAEFFL